MIRKRIYEIIGPSENKDLIGYVFDISLIALIVLSTFAVCLNSVDTIAEKYAGALRVFEIFSVAAFTIEYILRLWTAPEKYPAGTKHPYIKHVLSFIIIVDLVAILPFYIPFIVNIDLRFMRLLRLVKIVRVLKLTRYSNAMETLSRVVKTEKEKVMTTMFLALVMILLSASCMYFFENRVQPDQFPNIFATIWWAVATLTTVGYGDVVPITSAGKLLGGVIAIFGVALVALPAGIISAGLINQMNHAKNICPHCGKDIDECQ